MDNEDGDVQVNLGQMPDEVISFILKRVPAKDLLTACTQVSKQWHRILSQKFFWKEKLEEVDGYRLPWPRLSAGQSLRFYQMMAFTQPFRRNFIRDSWDLARRDEDCYQPDGRWHMNQEIGWEEDEDLHKRHDEVLIEVPPLFLHGQRWAQPELEKQKIMDIYRPTIVVSELVANRVDFDSVYQMQCYLSRERRIERGRSVRGFPKRIKAEMKRIGVETLEEAKNDRWVGVFHRKRFTKWDDECWNLVRHEFKQYPAGMRYLTLQVATFEGVRLARCSVMALCEGNNNATEAGEEEEAVQSRE